MRAKETGRKRDYKELLVVNFWPFNGKCLLNVSNLFWFSESENGLNDDDSEEDDQETLFDDGDVVNDDFEEGR